MAIGQRNVGLEEFLTWPEQEPPLELLNGVVTEKMSPTLRHGLIQSKSAELLNGFAGPRGLGYAASEVRAATMGGSAVPDVSFYRPERVQRDRHGVPLDYPTEPPDLVVEIASPGQVRRSLEERCAWFVSSGVTIALLVWPDDESVTVFRSGQQPLTLRGHDPIELSPVLPGFELTVQELFDTSYGR